MLKSFAIPVLALMTAGMFAPAARAQGGGGRQAAGQQIEARKSAPAPLGVGAQGISAAAMPAALDKVRFTLMPPNTDLPEMLCWPPELALYNQKYTPGSKKK